MSKAKKSRPLIKGKARRWSDADIERMAVVTDEDKAAAVAFFQANAAKPMKELLRAKRKGK